MDQTGQSAGIGILAKIVVDVIRAVFPGLQKRWVHLVVLVLCLGYGGFLAWQNPEKLTQAITASLTAFLSAVGANEVTRRRV